MTCTLAVIFGFILLTDELGQLAPTTTSQAATIVVLASIAPIAVAIWQARILRRVRLLGVISGHNWDRLFRQMESLHLGFWSIASLFAAAIGVWPTSTPSIFGMNRALFLDDIIEILPSFLSLALSWLAFENLAYSTSTDYRHGQIGAELYIAAQRTLGRLWQVCGAALIPLFSVFALRDILEFRGFDTTMIWLIASAVGLVALMCVFPIVLRFLVRSEQLDLGDYGAEFRGWRIKVWRTGDTVFNAVVAGVLPGFQTVLVSDGIIKHFTKGEVAAIIRHEIAHMRRWHVAYRTVLICLPVVLCVVCEIAGFRIIALVESCARYNFLSGLLTLAIVALLLGVFASLFVRPLSHWIEYDADAQSVLQSADIELIHRRATDMQDALIRLGHAFPELLVRSTLFHPSLSRRIARLNLLKSEVALPS